MGSAVRRGMTTGVVVAVIVLLSVGSAYWLRALNLSQIPPGPAEDAPRPRLAFAAVTDRPVYRTGEVAMLTISVTNIGQGDVNLSLITPCFWTFFVYDSHRATQFNWSVDRTCIAIIDWLVLAPSQSRGAIVPYELVTTDGHPLPSGQSYQVVSSFEWWYPGYQEFVSRTDTASFYVES